MKYNLLIMKIFNSLVSLIFIFIIISCKNDVKQNTKDSQQTLAIEKSIQKIEVKIEGMTCEIGCAKLIASKVSKLKGVTISNVNFEEKIGTFTFDASIISSKEILKNINGIAGGELYKTTDVKAFN